MADSNFNSIILVGLKHSGKSTMGKLLAEKLNLDFYDTDEILQQITGLSPREYYAQKGPVAFMIAEEEACKKIIEIIGDKTAVIATGGGICDNAPALTELQAIGNFVFLKLDMQYCIKRIEDKIQVNEFGIMSNLPSYVAVHNPKNKIQVHQLLLERFTERFTHYEAIADTTIELKNAPIQTNFQTILKALNI